MIENIRYLLCNKWRHSLSCVAEEGENMKCKDCYYARGTKTCKVMKYRFEDCWAYADKEEGEKREKAIRKYASSKKG